MSRLFGPFVQQGYIVPDLKAGVEHWTARGIGPFLVIEDLWIDSKHYGEPVRVHINAAFAMWGDQQIELIEPLPDSDPNIYSDYLDSHPQGGLQHHAVWSDDVEGQLAELKAKGVDLVVAQQHQGTHAYLDLKDSPGVMIQLMPTHQRYLDLFQWCADAADRWDGETRPYRLVADWE